MKGYSKSFPENNETAAIPEKDMNTNIPAKKKIETISGKMADKKGWPVWGRKVEKIKLPKIPIKYKTTISITNKSSMN